MAPVDPKVTLEYLIDGEDESVWVFRDTQTGKLIHKLIKPDMKAAFIAGYIYAKLGCVPDDAFPQ